MSDKYKFSVGDDFHPTDSRLATAGIHVVEDSKKHGNRIEVYGSGFSSLKAKELRDYTLQALESYKQIEAMQAELEELRKQVEYNKYHLEQTRDCLLYERKRLETSSEELEELRAENEALKAQVAMLLSAAGAAIDEARQNHVNGGESFWQCTQETIEALGVAYDTTIESAKAELAKRDAETWNAAIEAAADYVSTEALADNLRTLKKEPTK